jgi:hypothetical protein
VCVVCGIFGWFVSEVDAFSLLVWLGGNRYCGLVVGGVVSVVASEVGLRRELRCCLSVRRPACLLEFEARAESWGQGLAARAQINRPL